LNAGFSHESVSPKPQSIPYGLFRKFAEIFIAQGAPVVSLIPVGHLKLRIPPRIFEKIEINLRLFLGAWGKMICEKLNLKQKIL
jgi:hypothetical protein